MTKPGDVVEFKPGLHGLESPRNVGILLDRFRKKGTPWVRLVTLDGAKEIKAEHLSRKAFKARYEGDLKDTNAVQTRLAHLIQQNATGALAEQEEDDLSRLEEALWDSTCDAGREEWSEVEIAAAHYRAAPSPVQLRNVRDALDRCRRAGTGRFQTVGGRGDKWRPWTRTEQAAMLRSWQDLQALRAKLVQRIEGADGQEFQRVPYEAAQLTEKDKATLEWVKAAMAQFIDWDGVPDGGERVAGIGGLGAVRAFGMDLHRSLGFLAQDWITSEHTSTSSDYIHFLLESTLWTPSDAVAGLVRRHVNQEEFFEHVPDEAAELEARRFAEPTLAEDPDRTDLRHIPCWTIDPADARDFDDAVGIEVIPEGTRLWVHVADVSHYVRPDTKLDRHAKKRATSVYLPGQVLPMLPPRLSDHLCSLRDDNDRFALSVGLDIDAEGKVTARQFHKAIIRVTENLHYAEALQRADSGQEPFAALMALAKRIRSNRRGLDLETGELKVLLEESGFSALEKRADPATRMIETFMVAANEAVAEHLDTGGVGVLFRCHPLPDRSKAERFSHQLATMGVKATLDLPKPVGGATAGGTSVGESLLDRFKAGGGKLNLFGGGIDFALAKDPSATTALTPDDAAVTAVGKPIRPPGFSSLSVAEQEEWLAPFRVVLAKLAEHQDGDLADVATLKLLACMGRAFYTPDNEGHFGLALGHYCHFTSPIRRYPDLVVHRNLKWLIAGKPGTAPHAKESLRAMSDHCSNQERAADGLERRIKSSCLVLASLQSAGGSESPARITGLTPASLFVVRSDGIEARITARDLPGGPYQVDEWESMLFVSDRDQPDRLADASTRQMLEWLDEESGELRRIRARLADKVRVALAGRDVAEGRTGARLVRWAN